MSTKKPQIDLSKCPIGARVRLRNGQIKKLLRRVKARGHDFPFIGGVGLAWKKNGRYLHVREDNLDVVAILPSAKAKKAVKPLEYSSKLMSKKKVLEAIEQLEATKKLLEGLLKP